MTWILGFVKIVVMLGTLITIHELGHFLVARLFKVHVLKFAIGFGPKVFAKTTSQTEYTIRLIPFGGFVQMEGEERRSDDVNAFNNKPIWQRILVVAAGPIVNIVFALLVYFIICGAQGSYHSTIIADVDTSDNIASYGFLKGDEIVSVNGSKTMFPNEINNILAESNNDEFVFKVKRNGEKKEIHANIKPISMGYLGVAFAEDRSIGYMDSKMPVVNSGLKAGDVVIAINGVTTYDVDQIINTIRDYPNQKVKITVLRDMDTITYEVEVGANYKRALNLKFEFEDPSFFKRLRYAAHYTGYYISANIDAYADIFKGHTENVEVMGVVGIAGEITKTEAWEEFFYMMSAISLSLGIFNLLPVPALDGGRILLLVIEAIRRKPLKEKTEQMIILISFALILLLALYITCLDVTRIASS